MRCGSGGGVEQARHRDAGFTLVELMVTVSIVSILAAVAVPVMTGLINNSRLTGLTGALVSAVQFARSEAVRRNARVTLCASNDGVNCVSSTVWSQWIVKAPDTTTGTVGVVLNGGVSGNSQVKGPAAGLVFRPSGLLVAQAELVVCVPVTNPDYNQRLVTVALSGSPITTRNRGAGVCP